MYRFYCYYIRAPILSLYYKMYFKWKFRNIKYNSLLDSVSEEDLKKVIQAELDMEDGQFTAVDKDNEKFRIRK